jgi:hypothetical protein
LEVTLKDRADLIYRALRNLGALPQGQAPAAEDYQSISDLIDSVLAELTVRDVIYIASADAIEDEHFLPLGHILAWKAAPEFGAGSDQGLAALATRAEMDLLEMDRLDIKHNGLHMREMRSDYPVVHGIVNVST